MNDGAASAPEYAAYLRVREAVRALKAAGGATSGTVEPSDYWREELANFEYMLEASPLLISKLRHHCYHATGLKPYDYQKVSGSRLSDRKSTRLKSSHDQIA